MIDMAQADRTLRQNTTKKQAFIWLVIDSDGLLIGEFDHDKAFRLVVQSISSANEYTMIKKQCEIKKYLGGC